ncbi:MAG: thiamine phosphate synthase [Deltaproteobacteria bacterium]|nr:thiamine phosphate synthase [Deltaproteobacteria bacterium]
MNENLAGLYTIADTHSSRNLSPREIALMYLQGGATTLQLRMKGAPADQVFQAAREIVGLKELFNFRLIVNDSLEVAREINADGYHGGKEDPSIEEARRILGPRKLIGYSSHSVAEALEAEKRGADYVAFGAIFPSPSKGHDHPVQGIEKLREVVSLLNVPVVAIGGIGRDNIKRVLSTGVSMVAMISALLRPGVSTVDEVKFYRGLFKGRS